MYILPIIDTTQYSGYRIMSQWIDFVSSTDDPISVLSDFRGKLCDMHIAFDSEQDCLAFCLAYNFSK